MVRKKNIKDMINYARVETTIYYYHREIHSIEDILDILRYFIKDDVVISSISVDHDCIKIEGIKKIE